MTTIPTRISYVLRRMYILFLLTILSLSLPSSTFSKSLDDEEEFETTVKVSTKLGKASVKQGLISLKAFRMPLHPLEI
jgi:hypothetical protein